jgi:hypothetical protein
MITIEIRDAEKVGAGMAEVEIFCDSDGLSMLLRQLEHLKSGASHVHLMTPAWAGSELGEKTFGKGTVLVNHLRITMLPSRQE